MFAPGLPRTISVSCDISASIPVSNTTFNRWNKEKSVTLVWFELSLLVFYDTRNDILVIYVTQMCRRLEEEVVPTVGLPTP